MLTAGDPTALTLRAVFRLAYRQAEGLIASIISLLGLMLRVPDHTTLSRRAGTLTVPQPRPNNTSAQPLHLLVDSTGLKLCGAGEWLIEKHGTRTRRKLHIGVDAGHGQIVAAALTSKEMDDATQVGPLLDLATGPLASVTADGAYDQDGVYADVTARHPDAAVISVRNASRKSSGVPPATTTSARLAKVTAAASRVAFSSESANSGMADQDQRNAQPSVHTTASASTTSPFLGSMPHPMQSLCTLRTPRYRDARNTRYRAAR